MQYYAIQDKKTGRYISGTDFDRIKPRQILSSQLRPPKLFNGETLAHELNHRHINLKDYRVVVVEVKEARM